MTHFSEYSLLTLPMKTILLSIFLLAATAVSAQQTINDTIMHDGLQRAYILYVPASYTPGVPAPLVMNFHGYTSDSWQQMVYGNFRNIADTEGFILVHPMGTLDQQGQAYWNSGWGGTVDDIGFTAALIDSLSSEYDINQERVYSTGMSNGGFMSYTLACELSDRIAAIASVTGTMNVTQSNTCNALHPMPVMEIHGTADPTVPYLGMAGSMEPISNVLDYWVGFNNCDATAISTLVPNTSLTDGCTAEHYLYENGDNGVEVEHYKIIGGAHTWPGAPIAIGVTNMDISASEKIWEFFNKYDINGRRAGVGISETESAISPINIYPNPASGHVTIDYANESVSFIRVLNVLGAEISSISVQSLNSISISTEEWSAGLYFIEARTEDGTTSVSRLMITDNDR